MRAFPTRPGAILGVVHLWHLLGQDAYPGAGALVDAAREDARRLARGGVDGLLLENWKDASPGPFVGPDAVASLTAVALAVRGEVELPVGINVLPNDYRAAFAIAGAAGLSFVQLDVLVDPVRTDYSYSDAPPFELRVDVDDVAAWRRRCRAEGVTLMATVHPKHYALLEERALEESARAAEAAGADVVVVTGAATGRAPDADRLRRARRGLERARLYLGSGLSPRNAAELVPACDGAIVGTAFRTPDFAEVVEAQVRRLVAQVRGLV